MSVFIAILGLAFLILVHEAGHFFTARAVGMRPRRFYVGFPPAVVKTTRNGIEYGIGAIPLGGYVKIPGMHRPAPGDVDVALRPGAAEAARARRPGSAARSARSPTSDDDAARAALEELEQLAGDDPPEGLRAWAPGDRGRARADAYWRQRTWKRIAVIVAGPVTNLVSRSILFAGLFLVGGGKATTTVGQVLPKRPAAAIGLQARRRDPRGQRRPGHAAGHPGIRSPGRRASR